MPNDQAVHDVLENPYLSEQILAFLPMKDLIRCAQVDKNWHHLVFTSSSKLLKKLFLQPISRHIPVVVDQDPIGMCNTCPADILHPPQVIDKVHLVSGHITHPLLISQKPLYSMDAHSGMFFPSWGMETMKRLILDSTASASWRDMFVTQPPLKEISVFYTLRIHDSDTGDDWPRIKAARGTHGITWDQVVHVLQRRCFKWWGVNFKSIVTDFSEESAGTSGGQSYRVGDVGTVTMGAAGEVGPTLRSLSAVNDEEAEDDDAESDEDDYLLDDEMYTMGFCVDDAVLIYDRQHPRAGKNCVYCGRPNVYLVGEV
ncbi:Hypothetical protein D9617_25g060990 [Elsinoe fawcettii]|nr:Hypothetical protein D9617_25g060990 [Elsinoe fawcettii]